MDSLIAPCGLDCSKCGAFIAKQNNDDEIRKETAVEWSKKHNVEIDPKNINCDGCLSKTGEHFGYCNVCKIRLCAIANDLEDCKKCSEYKCTLVTNMFG